MTLPEITAQILSLKTTRAAAAWTIAELVNDAHAMLSPAEWLEWGQKELAFRRRWMFEMRQAVQLRADLEAIPVRHGALNDIPPKRMAMLAAIPLERLPGFLEMFPVATASRTELREAIQDYIGNPVPERFRPYRGMAPDSLIAGLDEPRAYKLLDPEEEYNLAAAHVQRLNACIGKLGRESILTCAEAFESQAALMRAQAAQ